MAADSNSDSGPIVNNPLKDSGGRVGNMHMQFKLFLLIPIASGKMNKADIF